MNSDNVTVLDSKVVTNNSVHTSTSIIKIVIGKDNQDCVLPLLALDENSVATKELESLHRGIGERDDGVVIIGGVSDTGIDGLVVCLDMSVMVECAHIREFGFFFFLRIAVDVSSA